MSFTRRRRRLGKAGFELPILVWALTGCGDANQTAAADTDKNADTSGFSITSAENEVGGGTEWSSGSASADTGNSTDAGEPETQPVNILLITSDDLGLQIGSYGEQRIETPHLDALAAEGVRFETAYVTQTSCSPSRSSIFTGVYPHTNGQYGLVSVGFSMHTEFADRTIPALLKKAGYKTGVIGKIHVGPSAAFPFDYAETNPDETRDVALVMSRAESFLAELEADQPFFLMVNFSDPHAFPGASWYYPAQAFGLPEDPIEPSADTLFAFQAGVDSENLRERVANYLNCVQRLDDGVGMLLNEIEESGRSEDTLVIFVGDHGPAFERGKTSNYEAGLRVPFMIRWPGTARPLVSTTMVSTVDIAPTILDAANVPIPEPMHGVSLWPMSHGAAVPEREHMVGEFHFHATKPFFPRRSIRDKAGHKLIHNLVAGRSKPVLVIDSCPAYGLSRQPQYDGSLTREVFDRHADPPEWELYDLATDPDELHNLAGDPAWAEVQQDLAAGLEAWQLETDDPFRDPVFVDEMLTKSQGGPMLPGGWK